ncbi:MAG: thioesterase [Actinobacteria bacterium]|nr:thioesterase [Actinomycetota bacterium]
MSSATRAWVRTPCPRPGATARLVLFPHAGGAASFYRAWADRLPAAVELAVVQYPGREDRLHEPHPASLADLAGRVAHALRPLLDRPTALFGHSLGASVAHETALRLEASGRPPLVRLFVSGRPGPARLRPGAKHLADDDALCADVAQLGGTREGVFDHPELRAIVLSTLRHDYRMAETYRPAAARPLTVPITAFVGDVDPEASVDEMGSWRACTSDSFDVRVFPGDHFYLVPLLAEVVEAVVDALRQSVPLETWAATP